ncbi:hypothetical protein DIPPA_08424 [Diplonema papillatum]|nr:hypothetical protein DIPPA_08424 [Diplonema papillatum]
MKRGFASVRASDKDGVDASGNREVQEPEEPCGKARVVEEALPDDTAAFTVVEQIDFDD